MNSESYEIYLILWPFWWGPSPVLIRYPVIVGDFPYNMSKPSIADLYVPRACEKKVRRRTRMPKRQLKGTRMLKRAANDVFAQFGKTPGFWWLHHQILG